MTETTSTVKNYLFSIWRCRYFWLSLVKMDLRTRYRRSVLGVGWSLLHPLAMTAILCFVFSKLFAMEVTEYGPYLLSGLAFWNFLSSALRDGCHCLFQGESYIRQYPAPIAIYPLRTTLGGIFHFLLALVVVLGLTAMLKGLTNPLALFWLIPNLLLLFVLCWAVAVIFGFINVYFPDTHHLCEVGLQILFYATPILYPPAQLKARGLGALLDYNPLTALLALVRDPILDGATPSAGTYLAALATVLVTVGIALAMLVRLQRRLIFHL